MTGALCLVAVAWTPHAAVRQRRDSSIADLQLVSSVLPESLFVLPEKSSVSQTTLPSAGRQGGSRQVLRPGTVRSRTTVRNQLFAFWAVSTEPR